VQINSREVAKHLFRLAKILQAEDMKLDAIHGENMNVSDGLSHEADAIKDLAIAMHEAKVKIDL
jgi:hypothetical protein